MSAPASGLDPDEIDLGLGRGLRFVGWHPDRALNPQYADLPDCDLVGLVVSHPRGDDPSRRCVSGIQFDDAPAPHRGRPPDVAPGDARSADGVAVVAVPDMR